jgi:ornithine carbamoyltransferase
LKDTAVVVSGMADAILARVGSHEEIEVECRIRIGIRLFNILIQELALNSSVPVINALTAKYHPLQALADITTLYETFSPDPLANPIQNSSALPLLKSPHGNQPLKVAWVGDGNNIIHSLLVSLPRLGISVNVATPSGYSIDRSVQEDFESTMKEGSKFKSLSKPLGAVKFTSSANDAVHGADVIITDTWISMGQESEKAARLSHFKGYQVTEQMAQEGGANPDWKFMHCLPRKSHEVDDAVFYNKNRSLVFNEAENRKYTVMSIFEGLFLKK